ncbi:hypothetical protein GCD22_01960 [Acidithiobacillus thiooxidans ATCC 19377]|uniref:Uncharacterized protein n=1 Tax=Acidithiobacillus thiooxidans ATCC 19377 TaxID=637390 RepID=A0A5P9XQB5_ACITH|nr:hypothetical protein GCD22_01960 [Acidithiobacillus thiooxidans ATCC 19377]
MRSNARSFWIVRFIDTRTDSGKRIAVRAVAFAKKLAGLFDGTRGMPWKKPRKRGSG